MAVELQLPMAVVTPSDVGRLMHEIEVVDNFVRQADLQGSGEQIQLPQNSRLFDELVSINKLDMHLESDRRQVIQLLEVVRTKAPILHMSFSTDPSTLFTGKLMTWLRHQIHPFVLLQIGLQPNIGAGCMLRSTNKYFDFSLRQRFADTRPLLLAKIRGQDETVTAPDANATVAVEATQ